MCINILIIDNGMMIREALPQGHGPVLYCLAFSRWSSVRVKGKEVNGKY